MGKRWQPFVGVLLGLLLGAWLIGTVRPSAPAAHWRMLPDAGGRIRSVVLQYSRGSGFVWPVYREFLRQQSPDLTVYVACPEHSDFAELRDHLGKLPVTLLPVLTHHAMTAWARDRWVPLAGDRPRSGTLLLAQKGELGQELWPQRAGDSLVAFDLASAIPRARAQRSELYFDGGDLLADGDFVFVTPAVLRRNLQHTVQSRRALLDLLRDQLGREPVLLENAPDHHAGMFMMAAGDRTMLVADPSLGEHYFSPAGEAAERIAGQVDFSAERRKHFDAVARLLTRCGYRVVRIPVVPTSEEKVYLTYVNVIIDKRRGRRTVYMPTYAGQDAMNHAAAQVWTSLGYRVQPIDCTGLFQRGGTLHCLVNVLMREGSD